MNNKFIDRVKRNKGITLIALVITIIVLIILATVAIQYVFGENGLIKRAETAKDIAEKAKREEQLQMDLMDLLIKSYMIQDEDDAMDFIEDLKNKFNIKGIYRIELKGENIDTIKLDCVREDKETLYREELEIDKKSSQIKLNSSQKVEEIGDEAKLLLLLLNAGIQGGELPPEVEVIGENVLTYNNNIYIAHEDIEEEKYTVSIYLEKYVIPGEWKEVHVGPECAIARDENDELWGWFKSDETENLEGIQPIKLKTLVPDLPDNLIVCEKKNLQENKKTPRSALRIISMYLISSNAANYIYNCDSNGIEKVELSETIDIKQISDDYIIDKEGILYFYNYDGSITHLPEENTTRFDRIEYSTNNVAVDTKGDYWGIFDLGEMYNLSEEFRKIGKEIERINNNSIITKDGELYYWDYDYKKNELKIEKINIQLKVKDEANGVFIDENGKVYVYIADDIVKIESDIKAERIRTDFGFWEIEESRNRDRWYNQYLVEDENGDLWTFEHNQSNTPKLIKILDVQDDWIQYSVHGNAGMVIDANKKLHVFGSF